MAFDAGMLAAVLHEINQAAADSKVEKVLQPQSDEVVFVLHCARIKSTLRLCINGGANNPKIGFSSLQKENPASPPMFCMLMRKMLTGARLCCAEQDGFERVARLKFETRDELGFQTTRFVIAEIMGKYSNLILLDENSKIIAALRLVDFSTSRKRQVLPGMIYELPPKQDKINPLEITEEKFSQLMSTAPDMPCDRFITANFVGISPLVAREISFRATGKTDASVCAAGQKLCNEFFRVTDKIKKAEFTPTIIIDFSNKPVEFSYIDIAQYGDAASVKTLSSFSELLDEYFGGRDKAQRIKQRAADIIHHLSTAKTRLVKKLSAQRQELSECEKAAEYKLYGDLITSNIYALERGMSRVTLTDYYSEDLKEVSINLDPRLSPPQNAARMYKKYNKAKTAKEVLEKQIALGEAELEYIESVEHSFEVAENESDLAEIRQELSSAGYASRQKNQKLQKSSAMKIMEFVTDGGWRVLCGKNNTQNDYITFKLAGKSDLWFHAKGAAGSHTLLICDGAEPSERDYTEAATIAATYSSLSETPMAAVDYTRVKNIKKPSGSKAGFVIYNTNYSAYVKPDKQLCEKLRIK